VERGTRHLPGLMLLKRFDWIGAEELESAGLKKKMFEET